MRRGRALFGAILAAFAVSLGPTARARSGGVPMAAGGVAGPDASASAPAGGPLEPAPGNRGGASPAAHGDTGPAVDGAGAGPSAGEQPAGKPPEEIPLRSADGHAFQADYYASARAPAPGIVLIPHLGRDRKTHARLAGLLRDRGYHVIVMDNTGRSRMLVSTPGRKPRFNNTMEASLMDGLMLDLQPVAEALGARPGVSGKYGIVGFGVGANMGLTLATTHSEFGVIALVFPGFGCADINSALQLNDLGTRPALLIETRQRNETDVSRVFRRIAALRQDVPRKQMTFTRDLEAMLKVKASDYEALDETILDWVTTYLPVPKS